MGSVERVHGLAREGDGLREPGGALALPDRRGVSGFPSR